MEEVRINNGGYDLEGVIWHQHSNKLMVKILEYFPKEIPVIDLGCGHNFYVSVLNYAGYEAIGTDLVNLGSNYFYKSDITQQEPVLSFKIKRNVISLEVGEHIPIEKSNAYLDNLCSFGGDIIMSWAVKGQAGVGHINCQENQWVIDQMFKRGYWIHLENSELLRQAVIDCHCSWFRNTLMYFKKR